VYIVRNTDHKQSLRMAAAKKAARIAREWERILATVPSD